MGLNRTIYIWLLTVLVSVSPAAHSAELAGAEDFRQHIRPILENYCFDCHAGGENKGKVAFDQFTNDQAMLENRDLWWHAFKNLRAGLMPPQKKPQPTAAEKLVVEAWIKQSVFNADPQNPDPGRVTIRRLNRAEYHNTIHDLLGVDYDTANAFPPDDTGGGFDDIGDVLTLPPMLLEKYVVAANQIVREAVPTVSKVMPEKLLVGREFLGGGVATTNRAGRPYPRALTLSYYKPAAVSNDFTADIAGKYQVDVSVMAIGKPLGDVSDSNRCRLIFGVDDAELLHNEYAGENGRPYHYHYEPDLTAGDHRLAFELQPLTPDQPPANALAMQIISVKISGPMAREHWVQPKDYKIYFPRKVPAAAAERRDYAREILAGFARRAFRRPPEAVTLDRLVKLAESVYQQPGKTFEAGVAQGMVAILSSPRFLFLDERVDPTNAPAGKFPYIDEFSLASRLSYLLWSSMPDEELLHLAETGRLRQNLKPQVARMLKDRRSEGFVKDFTGQWLRARDIETIPIDPRVVLKREGKSDPALDDNSMPSEIRTAMRQETEQCFDYVLRNDRSLLELLDADYTFLNGPLARHYGIPDVSGQKMRLVHLPADSPRGGILTQGTVLGVTSNPTRTSPVKRGLFILDNILGTPPPPPPPDIPPLEDAAKSIPGHTPSLRETLAAHRDSPLCSSCHSRMDPLGLALENFNAMGMWRDQEFNQTIDATGSLVTGESFTNIHEMKAILVKNHAQDFYTTLTEKLLTYALGRGLDYNDVETVDQIVARIETSDGRAQSLITGVIESAAFQRTRPAGGSEPVAPAKTRLRAEK
jgi:hypothetical protein